MEPIVTAIMLVAKTPNFLQYTESLTGPLDKVKIEKVTRMWAPIHSLWPPLTFTQTFIEACMTKVAVAMSRKWHVDADNTREEQVKAWAVAHGKQFRAMARHLSQAVAARKGWALTTVKAIVDNPDKGDAVEDERAERENAEEGGEEEEAEKDEEVDEAEEAEDPQKDCKT